MNQKYQWIGLVAVAFLAGTAHAGSAIRCRAPNAYKSQDLFVVANISTDMKLSNLLVYTQDHDMVGKSKKQDAVGGYSSAADLKLKDLVAIAMADKREAKVLPTVLGKEYDRYVIENQFGKNKADKFEFFIPRTLEGLKSTFFKGYTSDAFVTGGKAQYAWMGCGISAYDVQDTLFDLFK